MRFPLFIARRYLIAKKSHNLINIIAFISFIATAAVSLAMIVILSAFNGLEGLVMTMYNSFSSDIRISPEKGKVFTPTFRSREELKAIPGVVHVWDVLEDNALFRYQSMQHIGKIKGVEDGYVDATGLDSMIFRGTGNLKDSFGTYGIIGAGVDYYLSYTLDDELNTIAIYTPDRKAKPGPSTMSAFRTEYIHGSGIFSVQPELDNRFIIVPISLARSLLDYPSEVSYLELGLEPGVSLRSVKSEISKVIGPGFKVEDRREQQAFLYKVMRSEKWAIFLILSFILLIAAFNLVGSVTMLILDKRDDIQVLKSMGAENRSVRRIFLSEGMMIALVGTTLGLILGFIIVLLQKEFGLISMGTGTTFVVEAYPVKLKAIDFLNVLIMVAGIGALASWLPVRSRKF